MRLRALVARSDALVAMAVKAIRLDLNGGVQETLAIPPVRDELAKVPGSTVHPWWVVFYAAFKFQNDSISTPDFHA